MNNENNTYFLYMHAYEQILKKETFEAGLRLC